MHAHGQGWGSAPKPPIYHAAERLAFDLGRAARVIADRAWALEQKLRAVRLAGTPDQKEVAIGQLVAAYAEYEAYLARALETVCEIEGSVKAA